MKDEITIVSPNLPDLLSRAKDTYNNAGLEGRLLGLF